MLWMKLLLMKGVVVLLFLYSRNLPVGHLIVAVTTTSCPHRPKKKKKKKKRRKRT